MLNKNLFFFSLILLITLTAYADKTIENEKLLRFPEGSLKGWTIIGDDIWTVKENPDKSVVGYYVESLTKKGESATGILRSKPFIINKETQRFTISGWDGKKKGQNDANLNFVVLRSYPDGKLLRKTHVPGGNDLIEIRWDTSSLLDKKVYLEVVDNNPKLNPGGFAWIGFANYRQQEPEFMHDPVSTDDLYALKIDSNAVNVTCRTVPFLAAHPSERGQTKRVVKNNDEIIPVNADAETVYLLGMMNWGFDNGLAHWGEHPELFEKRKDQIQIGSQIGKIEIAYNDGTVDSVPVIMGATAWFVEQWSYAPKHMYMKPVKEPFSSRPEYQKILEKAFKIKEGADPATDETKHKHYFLSVKVRNKKIREIRVIDDGFLRGKPLVSAVTIKTDNPAEHLKPFGKRRVDSSDLEAAISSKDKHNWDKDLKALSNCLYTSEEDIPEKVELIDFPKDFQAAIIRFKGDNFADMLSNMWVANLMNMDKKFESDTGYFRETAPDSPFYGGYNGCGSWVPAGIYSEGAFSRTSDHYVTLALRCIEDKKRITNYVDFADNWFYFYRSDHDPNNGPPNEGLDIERYPDDAPGHWAFVMNGPLAIPLEINEVHGCEELDGHGATAIARWYAWKLLGKPTDDWLTKPRDDVYGKSRWDTTKEAAEFICWLMDYTAMDVVWSESEFTGWAGGGVCIPDGMKDETDPEKIRKNYANSDMYQIYPSFACLTGLKCSADIADAMGEKQLAEKWRKYADKIKTAAVRLLTYGNYNNRVWEMCPYSVLPSFQDTLVQFWMSHYIDGLTLDDLENKMKTVSLNTLDRQLGYKYGNKPVIAMGYGIGWLTHASLVADRMDRAGQLLKNMAKYSYDKNMEYYDEERGIDWRKWRWIFPEGSNIMPDGRWYRINDLSNGANQGPAMHALKMCAGIDDTDEDNPKIVPRIPDPFSGIEVEDYSMMVKKGGKLEKIAVNYQYHRKKDKFILQTSGEIPNLSIRFGPFESRKAKTVLNELKKNYQNVTKKNSGTYKDKSAHWIWLKDIKNIKKLQINY